MLSDELVVRGRQKLNIFVIYVTGVSSPKAARHRGFYRVKVYLSARGMILGLF